ncbi:hypothetical protein GGR57DRAFT_503672 [Xylariaceae sp. FL1272]|nr:hypothetical protein GGR57DRAFT_503672 [Xylariaceae sp. FL1272]
MAPVWTSERCQQLLYVVLHHGNLSKPKVGFPFGTVEAWPTVCRQLQALGFTSSAGAAQSQWSRIQNQRLKALVPQGGFPADMTSAQRLSLISGITIDDGNNAANIVATSANNLARNTAAANPNATNVARTRNLAEGGNGAAARATSVISISSSSESSSLFVRPYEDEDEDVEESLKEEDSDEDNHNDHGLYDNGSEDYYDGVDENDRHDEGIDDGEGHIDANDGVTYPIRGELPSLTLQDSRDITQMVLAMGAMSDEEFRETKKDLLKRMEAFTAAQGDRERRGL